VVALVAEDRSVDTRESTVAVQGTSAAAWRICNATSYIRLRVSLPLRRSAATRGTFVETVRTIAASTKIYIALSSNRAVVKSEAMRHQAILLHRQVVNHRDNPIPRHPLLLILLIHRNLPLL